jgi:LuxR family maltose regulon positive regulatory protein
MQLAASLLANARTTHAVPVILETLLIRAQMAAVLGDRPSSQADVAAAVELAQLEGYITVFLEEGPAVAGILASLLGDNLLTGAAADHAQKLLSAFPASVQTALLSTSPAAEPGAALIEPLSARELEILRLISEGYTNQQIARELVITLHTVKKHSSNIYSKLGVRNRTQAVAKAREAHLL